MLEPLEEELVRSVDRRVAEETEFLRTVVDIDSGTFHVEGVREVGRVFARELEAMGFETRWVELPPEMRRAGHLVAERLGPQDSSAAGRGRRVLLIGHLDTIFEGEGHRFERTGDRARGAGITDMKGGDVAIVFALRALHDAGALDGASVRVFLAGDEENPGLPTEVSRAALVEAAKNSDVALGFEPDSGKVAIGRRGLSTWSLEVAGEQGHSASVLRAGGGAGAVYEAARVVEGFRAAFTGHPTVTVNPGLFLGGTGVEDEGGESPSSGTAAGKFNVIARAAIVRGDLRFVTDEERDEAKERMIGIAAAHLPRAVSRLTFRDIAPGWPATDGNRAVLGLVDRVGRDLGLPSVEPDDPATRGFGDVNFIGTSVPGADGLGVRGSGEHGPDEAIDLASLAPCTARAAVAISRLLRQGVADSVSEAS